MPGVFVKEREVSELEIFGSFFKVETWLTSIAEIQRA